MSRVFFPAVLFSYLLLTCLAGSLPLSAAETAVAAMGQPLLGNGDEKVFREAISSIESNEGAYAASLPEHLLSLGLTLQRRGLHQEAVGVFKRGVHLTRINNGLYSGTQIPLLQGEITSHMALGQFSEADQRQHYMYRVQVRSLNSGKPRVLAFMQQADWQYNAYRLNLGEQNFGRLTSMWDLYRLAINDIVTREGDASPQLLAPLFGMLRAQYLISSYQGESQSSGFSSGESLSSQQEQNRFNAYRAQSYRKGQAVILAIYDVEQERHGEQSLESARALVMLGDWVLWHGERDTARSAYGDAMAELVERDDAQIEIERLFGQPVALPDLDGVRPLPPAVDPQQGDVLLEFGVTQQGKVVDLERVDENDANKAKANRLMRKLRKTRFRPRFEMGEPVDTEKVVRAYDIQ